MKPYRVIATLDAGGFAVLSIDPSKRHSGGGCEGVVLSVHPSKVEPDEFDREQEDDWFDDCGMTPSGSCMKAGSEECDFDCPFGALGGQHKRIRG